jgi:transcriptional regulator GlxA family with amidase domain
LQAHPLIFPHDHDHPHSQTFRHPHRRQPRHTTHARSSPRHLPLQIGALLFEGFELLDLFGPLEMFGLLGKRARIHMLAQIPGPIASTAGPACLADTPLAAVADNNLALDILLIPGGQGTRREVNNPGLLAQLRRASDRARHTASVCTGSALLAKAGLLDGKRATTNKHKLAYHWVTTQSPAVTWVPEARWVVDGKFFTSSGISAGTDMALALIAHLCGPDTARAIAQRAEYEWQENPARDPFAKLNGLV